MQGLPTPKEDVDTFPPQIPNHIESIHNKAVRITKDDLNERKIIGKSFFKEFKSDFIYSITFSESSKLEIIKPYTFSSLHLYSLTLPPSLKIIFTDSLKGCKFLGQISFLNNKSNQNFLEYVNDRAFSDTIIQSIKFPENIKEIGSYCFPSILKEIEFENGALELQRIAGYAFSNTSIEVFKMPSNIDALIYAKNAFHKCKKLKSIIFDYYVDKEKKIKLDDHDKVKKEKVEVKIQKRVSKKEAKEAKNDSHNKEQCRKSQDMATSLLLCNNNITNIEIFVSNLNCFLFYNLPNLTSISIPKSENAKFVKHQKCLYTKDCKKLIVAERTIKKVIINSACQIIANYAFNCKSLENVSFAKNFVLNEISFLSFYESQIRYITIPNSVYLINYGAFYKCKKLETVNIPTSLDSLDFFTFSFTKLKSILIPKNITKIKYGCFFKCSNLIKVTFEKNSNLEEIDDYAFALTKIDSISIPNNVKTIGDFCFYNCTNLKSISFQNESNIINFGYQCFKGTKIDELQFLQMIQAKNFSPRDKNVFSRSTIYFLNSILFNNITQVSIPSSIKEIGVYAFYNCLNLCKVEIINEAKSKMKTIADQAFCNCISLTEFKIPKNVNYFGQCCFNNCQKFSAKINVTSNNDIIIEKNAFTKSGIVSFISKSENIKINDSAFLNCENLLKFKAGVNLSCIIGNSVFQNCTKITNVIISPNVQNIIIGESCFMNSSIKCFNVPNNLINIPKFCFKSCKNLESVLINENSKITRFGKESFYKSRLKQIFIPHETKIIDKSCFEKCKQLNKLDFSNDLCECSLNTKAFYMSGIESITIPIGMNKIGSSCFENCTKLKSITFHEKTKLETIKHCTFKSTGIESLVFPSSIKIIGESSFENCKNLIKISFLNEDVTIFPFAFSECIKLQEVNCKSSLNLVPIVTNSIVPNKYFFKIKEEQLNKSMINNMLISNEPVIKSLQICKYRTYAQINEKIDNDKKLDLYTISKRKSNRKIKSIKIENGVYYSSCNKSILFCDFSIESLIIPKKSIILNQNAFRFSCLTNVDFEVGTQLKVIGKSVFQNTQIKEITIPNTVTIIKDYAFYNCMFLKKVNIASESQLEFIGIYAFSNSQIESIVFPSNLTIVAEFAFYKCIKLTNVINYSKNIIFGDGAFQNSFISCIQFPSKSSFDRSSFKQCKNLKRLDFIEKPEDLLFREDSFAFSGLEEIVLDCNVNIQNNTFSFCENLKHVSLTGENIKCEENSFNFTNIKELDLKIKIETNREYNVFLDNLKNKILFSCLEKLSLELLNIKKDYEIKIYLNDNCYVHDNELFYANLIDNNALFTDYPEEEMKANEIIKVPHYTKKFNFTIMPHVRQIQWPTNCIVEDLGPPGFFSYCKLVEIFIPKTIQTIPPHLFEHCHLLKKVQFEKGSRINEIGEYAFSNTLVEEVELPDTVQIIKQSAFSFNFNLKKVVFNGKIIEKEAFFQTGLREFNLPDNTEIIGSKAFQFCRFLNKFNINIDKSSLSKIGPYAFSETSIDFINIPKDVETIEKFTFNGCESLKKVVISSESKLKKIKQHSFSGNKKLETINIPKTIQYLSYKAFINTSCLTSILSESNQYFNVMKDKEVYFNDNSLIFVPRNLKQFEIKENCKVIHSGAFCGPNLERVSFQDNSLEYIEECGFAHSTGLKKIIIPNSIKKIGNEAFIDCQSLETVEFMQDCKLTEIPKYCFAFSGLKTINLPKSINIINHFSFYLCLNLEDVNLSDINLKYIGSSAFSETKIKQIKFPSTVQFIEDHAFEGIKSLQIADFTQCSYLCNLILLNKIKDFRIYERRVYFIDTSLNSNKGTFVSESSFYNSSVKLLKFNLNEYRWFYFFDKCINIDEIVFNDNIHFFLKKVTNQKQTNERVVLIGDSYKVVKQIWNDQEKMIWKIYDNVKCCTGINPLHFFNTSKLKTIYLGDDIKICHIPNNCFSFTCLKEIYIPSSVLTIKISAFKFCNNLEKITFSEKSQLTKIEPFAFYGCKNLTEISIPAQIKIIPKSCFSFTGLHKYICSDSIMKIRSKAFFGCKNLIQIIFNEGLTKLGHSSFANCISLKSVELPNSLEIINPYSFLNCINLKQVITTNKSNLVEINNGSFENTQIEELQLNPSVKKLFEPVNIPKLNKITFYDGELKNFKQFEDGTIYERVIPRNIQEESNFTNLIQSINNNDPINSINELELLSYKISTCANESYKLVFVPKNIEYLKIHENCFSIGNSVLDGLKNLTTIEYSRGKSNLILNFPNYCHLYTGKLNNIKNVKIFGDYTHIESNAFSDYESLESVEFGESTYIYLIPKFAFLGCINIQEIIIPNSCIVIDKGAFKNCTILKSVKFASSIKGNEMEHKLQIIEKEAFYNCSSLISILIPPTIMIIGEGAFMNCQKLSNFVFDYGKSNHQKLEKIDNNAFKNCSSLETFLIPQSCIYIGHSAFMNCTNLHSIVINENKIKCIKYRTFYNCSSLESFKLQISNCLEHKDQFFIGNESFMNCYSLKEVEICTTLQNKLQKKLSFCSKFLKETIQRKAFCNCKSLTNAKFLINDFEKIGEFSFMNCCSLKYIEISFQYSDLVFQSNLKRNTFIGSPNDIKIKLSYNNEQESEISISNFD